MLAALHSGLRQPIVDPKREAPGFPKFQSYKTTNKVR